MLHARGSLPKTATFPNVKVPIQTSLCRRIASWKSRTSIPSCTLPSMRFDELQQNTEVPSFFWRSASYQTLLTAHTLSRAFLFGLNKTEVHGLPRFLDLLKSRADYKTRRKGLLTISNHVSVLDEPLIWGALPLSFATYHGYMNHRWSLGAHDICFKNTPLKHFFTLGQVLPTHRLFHSPHGGPFQATMTEAVRLLSKISTKTPCYSPHLRSPAHHPPHKPSYPHDPVDPFSDLPTPPAYPSFPSDPTWYFSPSRYECNSYSWVHVFPEGMVHQSPPDQENSMRYFKWGVARLILEPAECPDVVPMFIAGFDQVMHESRTFPRFIPRFGKKLEIVFGEEVDTEAVFGDLRRRWRELEREFKREYGLLGGNEREQRQFEEMMVGIVPAELGECEEARTLRMEVAKRLREEVAKVRRSTGRKDEDPKCGMVETWLREGPMREGKMEDGSWVKDT